MAGMYIHFPFCRKICSYCDFYKTTLSSLIPGYLKALLRELELRKDYLEMEPLETIYLGGGTPSLISADQLTLIFNKIRDCFDFGSDCEVTMESNPDDMSSGYLRAVRELTPVNRLSIGVQSFNDEDLLMLNRRHTAIQAIQCIDDALNAGFKNITIDLIYGLPGMSTVSWGKNLEMAFSSDIQHLSAYHLTIEPNTAFARMASRGLIRLPEEDESSAQFGLLNKMANNRGFIHYEISNLAREGFMSKHNSNYWLQKKYIGLGPSAHSYNLVSRQWNIRNVRMYIDALANGKDYAESETLDLRTQFNEYLMLSLRTSWGVDTSFIVNKFGDQYLAVLKKNLHPFLSSPWIAHRGNSIMLTPAGWMVSDYIVSRLMVE